MLLLLLLFVVAVAAAAATLPCLAVPEVVGESMLLCLLLCLCPSFVSAAVVWIATFVFSMVAAQRGKRILVILLLYMVARMSNTAIELLLKQLHTDSSMLSQPSLD